MPRQRSVPRTAAGDGQAADRLALTALLCGAVGIAFAPIFVRLSELAPTATAFHRLFLALPVLWLWKHIETRRAAISPGPSGSAPGARRLPPPARRLGRDDGIGLAAAGLLFAGDLAFWHWSIRFTTVANATLLANFAPIFVTLAGYLFLSERFSRQFLLGMALAIAGAVTLMGRSLAFDPAHFFGDTLGLITAMFYAGYIVAVARLRARLTTVTIMAWSGLVTCAALLTISLLSGEDLVPSTVRGWAMLVGLALISHVGGQSLDRVRPSPSPARAIVRQPAPATGYRRVAGLGHPGGAARTLAGLRRVDHSGRDLSCPSGHRLGQARQRRRLPRLKEIAALWREPAAVG